MRQSLDVTDIAAALALSTTTVARLLATGEISSEIDGNGNRVAPLAAVLAWRDRQNAQRRALGELARESQLTEGMAPRRPPSVIGDLNTDDEAGEHADR